jgi:hypothetical protein
VSHMIAAAAKSPREFDAKPSRLVPYLVNNGLILAGFLGIIWFVS